MKQIILGVILVFGIGLNANSQVVHKHAIGARAEGSSAFGAEFSYQYGFNDMNRLELDAGAKFGFGWARYTVTGCFHWAFNIMSGWNWFVGPGVQFGIYNEPGDPSDNRFPIAIGAQGGMEFDFNVFDVPVCAGIDVRPMFDVFHRPPGFLIWVPGAAASVRYTFGD